LHFYWGYLGGGVGRMSAQSVKDPCSNSRKVDHVNMTERLTSVTSLFDI